MSEITAMGCRHRELEMSLSLDGRLPSGRRHALLRHVASCAACASTWARMQKAQDVALALVERRPSPTFRSTLRDRITAGESAPEAVYREPVPTLARVRHVLAGAAAAA